MGQGPHVPSIPILLGEGGIEVSPHGNVKPELQRVMYFM